MKADDRTIVVTGANGFIGTNLTLRLGECGLDVAPVVRESPQDEAAALLASADVVFHLAGVNRAEDRSEFMNVNHGFSVWLAERIAEGGRRPLVVCASTIKVDEDSEYGRSKLAGEEAILALGDAATVSVWRLPNVFGKWARPFHNSVVATFSHNLARGLEIGIDDPAAPLHLLHIDDLLDQWLALLDAHQPAGGIVEPRHVHQTTVGEVVVFLRAFAEGRGAGLIGPVGEGLARALYATFVSYLPEAAFSYELKPHTDARGSFTEVLRTPDCGQVSVLTAPPGTSRGGHYHHAKVEKFVVVQGRARFRFRHVVTGETRVLETSAGTPAVVETVPGWAHDITNTGDDMMVALVWASEAFDPDRPDTYAKAF